MSEQVDELSEVEMLAKELWNADVEYSGQRRRADWSVERDSEVAKKWFYMAERAIAAIPKRESIAIKALKEISVKGRQTGYSRIAMANIAYRALLEIKGES